MIIWESCGLPDLFFRLHVRAVCVHNTSVLDTKLQDWACSPWEFNKVDISTFVTFEKEDPGLVSFLSNNAREKKSSFTNNNDINDYARFTITQRPESHEAKVEQCWRGYILKTISGEFCLDKTCADMRKMMTSWSNDSLSSHDSHDSHPGKLIISCSSR